MWGSMMVVSPRLVVVLDNYICISSVMIDDWSAIQQCSCYLLFDIICKRGDCHKAVTMADARNST